MSHDQEHVSDNNTLRSVHNQSIYPGPVVRPAHVTTKGGEPFHTNRPVFAPTSQGTWHSNSSQIYNSASAHIPQSFVTKPPSPASKPVTSSSSSPASSDKPKTTIFGLPASTTTMSSHSESTHVVTDAASGGQFVHTEVRERIHHLNPMLFGPGIIDAQPVPHTSEHDVPRQMATHPLILGPGFLTNENPLSYGASAPKGVMSAMMHDQNLPAAPPQPPLERRRSNPILFGPSIFNMDDA